jgi:hypothetical protein
MRASAFGFSFLFTHASHNNHQHQHNILQLQQQQQQRQSTLIHLSSSPLSTISIITPFDHTTNQQQLNNTTNTYIMSSCQQSLVRPQPQPQQNRMDINSDGSVSSTPMSTSGRGSMHNIFSSPEIARCSRCHRTPSIDITTGKSNMVQYGLNQYYCSRCAGMVGYYSR